MTMFTDPTDQSMLFNDRRAPLAERVRPHQLTDYIGQQHLLGKDAPLRRVLETRSLPSLILWGPPGVGKTTLAKLIAQTLSRPMSQLSAVSSGVKDVREAIKRAKAQSGTILFIDEIHRFSKSQQDALLHAVEDGTITLIGATTENPSFEVIRPLLSRAQVYTLEPLTQAQIETVVSRAILTDEELSARNIQLRELDALYHLSGGDARKALSLLELIVSQHDDNETILVTNAGVQRVAKQKIAQYDKNGEQHYDTVSAFIKSIRGGDPNGAVYWLARMLDGGEELRFIARRLIISASEDIGNANPNALLMAMQTFEAVNVIGMPEARIILSQCATYLATSPKSNASYNAINQAMAAVKQQPNTPVPLHLRNAPTQLMKDNGYGEGYKYTHNYAGADGNQEYLPEGLENTAFYRPKAVGSEAKIKAYMDAQWGEKYGGEPPLANK